MLPKRVETIDRLPHEGKDIVHSSRKLETRVHHWNRHRLGNNPEPSPGHRGRLDHNRCSHVRRPEGLILVPLGKAMEHRAEALGETFLEPLSLFGVHYSG